MKDSEMFTRDPSTAEIGKEILPFVVGYLPDYFQKKAEVELHDTPERRAQALRQLRELIKNDKHTKNFVFDDEFILQYLRVRKFNVARAFSQVKAYSQLRKRNPNIFRNLHFESIVSTQKDKTLTFLPWRCQDGCVILLIQLDNWDPETFPVEEVKRAFAVYLLQSLRDPMTQVNGLKVILDVRSNPIRHLRHATPNNLYLIYHGIQECVPLRYKQVHVVNKSVTFKAAWIIVKPFLSDKIKKRVFFHDSAATLHKHFPRSVIPKEYGGDLDNYDMTDWLRNVMTPEKLDKLGGVPVSHS